MFQKAAAGFRNFAAEQLLKGMVIAMAKSWTIAGLLEYAAGDKGLDDVLGLNDARITALKAAAKKSEFVRKLTVQDILNWINEANPTLYQEIFENQSIIAWFHRVWERDRERVLGLIEEEKNA